MINMKQNKEIQKIENIILSGRSFQKLPNYLVCSEQLEPAIEFAQMYVNKMNDINAYDREEAYLETITITQEAIAGNMNSFRDSLVNAGLNHFQNHFKGVLLCDITAIAAYVTDAEQWLEYLHGLQSNLKIVFYCKRQAENEKKLEAELNQHLLVIDISHELCEDRISYIKDYMKRNNFNLQDADIEQCLYKLTSEMNMREVTVLLDRLLFESVNLRRDIIRDGGMEFEAMLRQMVDNKNIISDNKIGFVKR